MSLRSPVTCFTLHTDHFSSTLQDCDCFQEWYNHRFLIANETKLLGSSSSNNSRNDTTHEHFWTPTIIFFYCRHFSTMNQSGPKMVDDGAYVQFSFSCESEVGEEGESEGPIHTTDPPPQTQCPACLWQRRHAVWYNHLQRMARNVIIGNTSTN